MRYCAVNGVASDVCSVQDRGLQYGDGLFETVLCVQGVAVNFVEHWARLEDGCRRLGIACPDIQRDVRDAIARWGGARAVAKLVVTRGSTARGYRCPPSVPATWILTIHDAPRPPVAGDADGVAVKLCRTLLAFEDPQLAGLKHLNRLPQVLARREWDTEYHDGLLADHDGNVIEGCTSNVFLVTGEVLSTPDLSRCGVRGVVRQKVLDQARALGIRCEVTHVRRDDLDRADEVFLTNAVYGIVPVGSIEGRPYRVGPMTARLRRAQGVSR
jgi:4-amino-4-deoxychorismate lyase